MENTCACVLGLGLEHSCPWPREVLSSERLFLALASDFFVSLASDFFVSLASDFFVSLALALSLVSSTPPLVVREPSVPTYTRDALEMTAVWLLLVITYSSTRRSPVTVVCIKLHLHGRLFSVRYFDKMDVAKLHIFNNVSHCDKSYLTAENDCPKLFLFDSDILNLFKAKSELISLRFFIAAPILF